jgi:vanillate O-demethylase monooxygenase subunit
MIAKDCWYVVATSAQLLSGQPLAVEIAATPLVLYRRPDGTPVALDDRCAHRLAPLSLGRVEGDTLRCLYHGARFDAAGRCVEVPGQERVPAGFVQRRFAVAEQQGWLWLWLGDAEQADRSLLPPTPELDRAQWHVIEGELTYEVDHQLVNDNLCDLSHVAFVHEATLARMGGAQDWAHKPVKITDLPRGMRFERWLVDTTTPPFEGLPSRADAWIAYDYLLPGVFLMVSTLHPVGTARRLDFGSPPDTLVPLHRQASTQAVTPLGPGRTHYRYAAAVACDEPQERVQIFFSIIQAAFAEDRRMLEAQHRLIERSPGRALSATTHDRAPVRFRRLTEAQGAFVAVP